MTGEQRYKQIMTKCRLIAQRELRQFMAGEIDILPCSGDRERAMIIAELDKLRTDHDL
jgi:hypothetical protein